MKLKFLSFTALCAVVLLSALLVGCPNPVASGGKGGSLTVTVSNNINARTLLPPIDMNAASYTVSGSGPNGQSFSQSTSGGSVTISNLAFGPWAVTVNALNAAGTVIGQGQGNASVNTGETTTLTVTVTPLAGIGSLNLTVNWTASQVQSPSIQASLTPLGPANLSFTIQGAQATYSSSTSGSTIPVGYQTLTLQLMDNNIAVIGAVEVVRIVAGQTTSGTYTFTNVNQPGGTIVVNITPALANPIPVSISGVGSTLTEGASMTATASVSDGTQNVTYVWYLNGVSQTTGPSYTFGNTLKLGYYRLDVTAFTADGTRAGSDTASFQVVPMVSDSFESYPVGSYPSAGGWFMLWNGTGSAAVVSGIAHSGNQSFRLEGYTSFVRADGLNLPLGSVNVLTYSAAVRVPTGSLTGATVGFFIRISSNESRDFNSVEFSPGQQIVAVGQLGGGGFGTGIICQPDTWYQVKVQLDYSAGIMNVWVNGQEVLWGIPAGDKTASNIFFIGTNYSGSVSGTSSAYFDDVVIY